MKPLLQPFGPAGQKGTEPTGPGGRDPGTVGGSVMPDGVHVAPTPIAPVPVPPPPTPHVAPSLLLLL